MVGMKLVKLRVTAGALLHDNDRYLLMKRSLKKKIAPGLWAGVGGHLEKEELNDPAAACLREIGEETGILPCEIKDLALRYIIHSMRGDEVHLQYHFFGEVNSGRELKDTEEGVLYWVKEEDMPELDMSFSIKNLVKHYNEVGKHTGHIYVGTCVREDTGNYMNWAVLDRRM